MCDQRSIDDAWDGCEDLRSRPDPDCICKGNWRLIVKESEPFFGRKYRDARGHVWIFFGVVHADDDYYYGLVSNGSLVLASCVGSLGTNGFTLIEEDEEIEKWKPEDKLLKEIFGEEAG